jgi:hypothetical protein
MSEQPTCGQGLAANAALPEMLGNVVAAMADNLDAHRQALDVTDGATRQEHEAYTRLPTDLRHIGDALHATSEYMAAAHDLPMGKHNMALMTTPRVLNAFEVFVQAEQHLLQLLQARIEQDRQMLQSIAGHVRGGPQKRDTV